MGTGTTTATTASTRPKLGTEIHVRTQQCRCRVVRCTVCVCGHADHWGGVQRLCGWAGCSKDGVWEGVTLRLASLQARPQPHLAPHPHPHPHPASHPRSHRHPASHLHYQHKKPTTTEPATPPPRTRTRTTHSFSLTCSSAGRGSRIMICHTRRRCTHPHEKRKTMSVSLPTTATARRRSRAHITQRGLR
ncbi:hypothetical protein K439DRAFT_411188 [Ramaria rubella]|nr:hypothetical protein K439DRAFT_411188 [Ramaria rubella]